MNKILIIPDIKDVEGTMSLQKKYNLGFEYNDFYMPDVLDNKARVKEIITEYKKQDLPSYTTLHGAFFDVIPFSVDSKIREISLLRINQSIDAAREVGAGAVVFHTNYNPFLNSSDYIDNWIKQNTEIWQSVLKENGDISVYLENMFDISPDIIAGLAKKLSEYENFGLCLDWAHASVSGVKAEVWAKETGKYVRHIHINDNDLKSDLHLAWGDGKIERKMFYDCYDKYFSNATVLIETSSFENKLKSLQQLEKDGFLK
ncbi:MAG: TIM barrel protein [Clostridia bacterium]|nr:TIM barrel protein [Clostridia bacterium]